MWWLLSQFKFDNQYLFAEVEMDLELRLLNDPDENVRIVAIATVKQTLDHTCRVLKKDASNRH
jgi:hypothetical protein